MRVRVGVVGSAVWLAQLTWQRTVMNYLALETLSLETARLEIPRLYLASSGLVPRHNCSNKRSFWSNCRNTNTNSNGSFSRVYNNRSFPRDCSNNCHHRYRYTQHSLGLCSNFYDDCQPEVRNWPSVFENHRHEYLNGIQYKIRHSVNGNQNLREELTDLIRHSMYSWDDLHNIGVLFKYDSSRARVISTLINRSYVDTICQPTCSLSWMP